MGARVASAIAARRMTREALREFCDDVCSGRCDKQKVGAISEIDMSRSPVFFFVVEARRHRILGERLQSERCNEFRRVFGHDDESFVSLFHQQAGQLRRFVCSDGTGNAEHNAFRFVFRCLGLCLHGGKLNSEFVWARISIRHETPAEITFCSHDVPKLLQVFFN